MLRNIRLAAIAYYVRKRAQTNLSESSLSAWSLTTANISGGNSVNSIIDLQNRLRKRIARALSGQRKADSALALLCCSFEDATKHIQRRWYRPDMSWDTWGSGPGTWQIDHIKPLSSFDLSDPAQQAAACHISNLQPLWHDDHARKSAIDRRRLRHSGAYAAINQICGSGVLGTQPVA